MYLNAIHLGLFGIALWLSDIIWRCIWERLFERCIIFLVLVRCACFWYAFLGIAVGTRLGHGCEHCVPNHPLYRQFVVSRVSSCAAREIQIHCLIQVRSLIGDHSFVHPLKSIHSFESNHSVFQISSNQQAKGRAWHASYVEWVSEWVWMSEWSWIWMNEIKMHDVEWVNGPEGVNRFGRVNEFKWRE